MLALSMPLHRQPRSTQHRLVVALPHAPLFSEAAIFDGAVLCAHDAVALARAAGSVAAIVIPTAAILSTLPMPGFIRDERAFILSGRGGLRVVFANSKGGVEVVFAFGLVRLRMVWVKAFAHLFGLTDGRVGPSRILVSSSTEGRKI